MKTIVKVAGLLAIGFAAGTYVDNTKDLKKGLDNVRKSLSEITLATAANVKSKIEKNTSKKVDFEKAKKSMIEVTKLTMLEKDEYGFHIEIADEDIENFKLDDYSSAKVAMLNIVTEGNEDKDYRELLSLVMDYGRLASEIEKVEEVKDYEIIEG